MYHDDVMPLDRFHRWIPFTKGQRCTAFMFSLRWCENLNKALKKQSRCRWSTTLWCLWNATMTLHWRHNDHDGVSNHQPRGCLLNRLFRRRSKKTSKLRVTGLCVGNSPWPVNSPHKGPVTRKMFPLDDVIMICIPVCFPGSVLFDGQWPTSLGVRNGGVVSTGNTWHWDSWLRRRNWTDGSTCKMVLNSL